MSDQNIILDLLEKLNNLPKEKEHLREEISRTVQELHHRN